MKKHCKHCDKFFELDSRRIIDLREGIITNVFCSTCCYKSYVQKTLLKTKTKCSECQKGILKNNCEIKKSKSGNCFCSRSCSASFNNKLKTKSRRSKCEILLFELLTEKFPELKIISNDKETLEGFEVDIWIPEIKLAIEWNGIVHFKPIYGQEKLNKIQSIDQKKQELAVKKDINLIVIPDLVSSKKYVHEIFQKISKVIQELI